jgi:hypothetical protein
MIIRYYYEHEYDDDDDDDDSERVGGRTGWGNLEERMRGMTAAVVVGMGMGE